MDEQHERSDFFDQPSGFKEPEDDVDVPANFHYPEHEWTRRETARRRKSADWEARARAEVDRALVEEVDPE